MILTTAILVRSRIGMVGGADALPHICCAIMTTKAANVARLTRAMVKSCVNRARYLPLLLKCSLPLSTFIFWISPSPSMISSSLT